MIIGKFFNKTILPYLSKNFNETYIKLGFLVILYLVLKYGLDFTLSLSLTICCWCYFLISGITFFYSLKKSIREKREQKEQEEKKRQEQKKRWDDYQQTIFDDFDKFFNDFTKSYIPPDKLSNAYSLLKVSRNDTNEEIKKSYRTFALMFHPDKWENEDKRLRDIAERNFKKLNSAYELIKKDRNMK